MKNIILTGLAALVIGTSFLPVSDGDLAEQLQSEDAEVWFDFSREGYPRGEREIVLPEYPDAVFHCDGLNLWAEKAGEDMPLYCGMPIWSVYFCDLNGDGRRELCSQLSMGSGIIDERIVVCDYAAGDGYSLEDRGEYDYFLKLGDGELRAWKSTYPGYYEDGEVVAEGKLSLAEDGNGGAKLIIEEN